MTYIMSISLDYSMKVCGYCNSVTTTLCKYGACYTCHGHNLCHGDDDI